ncbi:MAG: PfkB family carbohydrate kinase [Phycisphaerales bacterium]
MTRSSTSPEAVPRALVGFDGFIDDICTAVSGRGSMEAGDFTEFTGIAGFAERLGACAGRSTNIELVVREERFGGNGPLLAGGLASLGAATTYVGCVADEERAGSVHPVFAAFASRCGRVVPLAAPSRTECLEFADGKVMFNKVFRVGREAASMQGVRWAGVLEACGGLEAVRAMVGGCSLVGIVNWSIMAGVEDIVEGLARDVLGHIPPTAPGVAVPRRVLIDISDPAKRSAADIRRFMGLLGAVQRVCPVTLGLNLSEAEQVWGAVGAGTALGAGSDMRARCVALAREVRGGVGLEYVVVHPREGAAGAGAGGAVWVEGPFTPTPRLSTGAGDHFNAGLGWALMQGMTLEEALAFAVATSGAYVRDAESPSRERVLTLLSRGATPQNVGPAGRA